jgi:cysteine desulfurase/selenocysteine lyase
MPATDTRTAPPSPTASAFDAEAFRADFPTLRRTVHDDETPLVYLDNAATSQKPQPVIDRMQRYYTDENSNVHRGVHHLSQKATDAYEEARASVADLIGAPAPEQVIWTRGTTEAINLVASTFGRMAVEEGDEIVVTEMEHHANIVPWQQLCEQTGATLRVAPITDAGELDYDAYLDLLGERTKLVAVSHVSNTLGTINPVERMIEDAHAHDIPVLVDGAQSIPHMPIDVEDLGADFYCFSGHKMFGPTGIGVLYGRAHLLEAMPPYQCGGDMIDRVSFEGTTYAEPPHKFEAGTPNIAAAVGMGTAAEYLQAMDREGAQAHEDELLRYATERIQREIDDVRLVGTAARKTGVLSFLVGDIHPYDAGSVLDRLGVAVRTGHHCTQPLIDRMGLPGTVRASFAAYNTKDDVDRLIDGLDKVQTMFG